MRTSGFEYTLEGIVENDADAGLLAEIHRESHSADPSRRAPTLKDEDHMSVAVEYFF